MRTYPEGPAEQARVGCGTQSEGLTPSPNPLPEGGGHGVVSGKQPVIGTRDEHVQVDQGQVARGSAEWR